MRIDLRRLPEKYRRLEKPQRIVACTDFKPEKKNDCKCYNSKKPTQKRYVATVKFGKGTFDNHPCIHPNSVIAEIGDSDWPYIRCCKDC